MRVEQPFQALQNRGWDVQMHAWPFDLNHALRTDSLVIWQRPVATSWSQWRNVLQLIRRHGSLLVVEWDDHPHLFPVEIQARMREGAYAHLRLCHVLQCSSSRLQQALKTYHRHPLVVENGIERISPLNLAKHEPTTPTRIFLGNLNRTAEHQQIERSLNGWLEHDPALTLVCVGPSGLSDQLPQQQLEQHPLLDYWSYRQVLGSCQLALLPLQRGEPQACKTPIKWLEAAAESTVVIGGPELYRPWLQERCYGIWSSSVELTVPLAQALMLKPSIRQTIARQAHRAAYAHALEQQVPWREELYRHLWRLRSRLDHQLVEQHPELQGEAR